MCKKRFYKGILFLLVFLISVNFSLSISLSQKGHSIVLENGNKVFAKNKPNRIREIAEKRTLNSKHFLNEDGTITAEISSGPIHFKNDKGEYEDIDLNIAKKSKKGGSHSVEKNIIKAYFDDEDDADNPTLAGVETKNKNGQERWISYKLVGAAPEQKAAEGNKFKFKKVFKDVDLEYSVLPDRLKEDILIRKPLDGYRFTFIVKKSEGVRLEQQGNGEIYVIDEETKETLWTIEKSFAEDSSELKLRTDNVRHVLGKQEYKGKEYDNITVMLEDREFPGKAVYPITIDPTTTYNVSISADDGYVWRSDPYYPPISDRAPVTNDIYIVAARINMSGNYYIYNGLVRFDTSSIPDTATIQSARFIGYINTKANADSRDLTADWFSFATITNASCYSETAQTDALSTPVSDLTQGTLNYLTLYSPENISKTGYTGLRFHISGGHPTWDNRVLFNSLDVSSNKPRLEVTYNPNKSPIISITSPTSNQSFSENDTAYKPQITVSDPNGDTLTCNYYLDNILMGSQNNITNATSTQTVTFANTNGINMSTLSEGTHTIKCEVADNIDAPVTSTVSIKVDKSNPVINTNPTITSSTSSITVSGSSVTDSISGLDPNPYRYTVGSNVTSWVSTTSYTQGLLNINTQYPIKFEARDLVGHIASNIQNIYTKAVAPGQLTVTSNVEKPAYELELNITDGNPSETEYQILNMTNNKYITPEGTPTASPVWVPLNNDTSNIKKITVQGLNPTTPYTFEVKARNGNGVETTGIQASGTTKIPPPGAPTGLTAIAKNDSIKLNWEPLMDITGYEVQVDGTTIIDNGTSTTYTNYGLNPGVQHKYRVRARNDGGAGDWSAELIKSTLPSKPDIPSNINAIASSNSVIVTWSPVSGATGYDVMVDGGTINGGLEINGPSTNFVHTGLTPGTHHTYKVRSINPGGKSDWSSEVSATALVDIPLVPTNLHATPSQNQVILAWDAVTGASYEVEVDGNILDNSTRTSYIHTNLTPNTPHTYKVRSKKMGTTSDWSATLNVSTLNNVFGTPTNIKWEPTDTSITLSWDAVTDATGYDVEADGIVIDNGADTTSTFDGLNPNTNHAYRVRAKNGQTTSEWSALLPISTYLLGTPKNITASSADSTITLSWDNVINAAGYDIEMDGNIVGSVSVKCCQTYSFKLRQVSSCPAIHQERWRFQP